MDIKTLLKNEINLFTNKMLDTIDELKDYVLTVIEHMHTIPGTHSWTIHAYLLTQSPGIDIDIQFCLRIYNLLQIYKQSPQDITRSSQFTDIVAELLTEKRNKNMSKKLRRTAISHSLDIINNLVIKYDYWFYGIDTPIKSPTGITSLATLNNRIICGTKFGTIKILDLQGRSLMRIAAFEDDVVIGDIKIVDTWIVCLAQYMGITVIDSTTGNISVEIDMDSVVCMDILHNKLIMGSAMGVLEIRDLLSGKLLTTLVGHTGEITCITTYQHKYVISGSTDHNIRVWNPLTGACLAILEGHQNNITCITSFNNIIISGSNDRTVKIWTNFINTATLTQHGNKVTNVITMMMEQYDGTYSRLIVSASDDGTIEIYIPISYVHKSVITLYGFPKNGTLKSIRAPSGKYDLLVASGPQDNVKIWDISRSYEPLLALEGTMSRTFTILSDNRIVTGSQNCVTIWE